MSAAVLYMSMSLDGFIAGPNEGPGNGLGDGGERLHDWLWGGEPAGPSGVPSSPSGVNGRVLDESLAAGAVFAGRGTFEPAAAGAVTTTTECRSSSSAATSLASTSRDGRS